MSGIEASTVIAVATAAAVGFVVLLSVGTVGVGLSSAAIDSDTTRLSGTVTDEDGETASEVSPDARDDDPVPATNREQVLTLLFFAGTFLAAMITAAVVGLYRNRFR